MSVRSGDGIDRFILFPILLATVMITGPVIAQNAPPFQCPLAKPFLIPDFVADSRCLFPPESNLIDLNIIAIKTGVEFKFIEDDGEESTRVECECTFEYRGCERKGLLDSTCPIGAPAFSESPKYLSGPLTCHVQTFFVPSALPTIREVINTSTYLIVDANGKKVDRCPTSCANAISVRRIGLCSELDIWINAQLVPKDKFWNGPRTPCCTAKRNWTPAEIPGQGDFLYTPSTIEPNAGNVEVGPG